MGHDKDCAKLCEPPLPRPAHLDPNAVGLACRLVLNHDGVRHEAILHHSSCAHLVEALAVALFKRLGAHTRATRAGMDDRACQRYTLNEGVTARPPLAIECVVRQHDWPVTPPPAAHQPQRKKVRFRICTTLHHTPASEQMIQDSS